MTLLSAADIAAIRAVAEDTSVSMPLTATIVRPATVTAGKAGPATTAASSVQLGIWSPRGDRVQVLQDLGGGRASRFGGMPYGTDVRAGDILVVGTDRYQVHGVDDTGIDQVLLALSKLEVR